MRFNPLSWLPLAATCRYMAPRLNVNVGTRYGFKLMGKAATLRGQITNLLDNNAATCSGPGIYGPPSARQFNAFLTVDY